jgi:hypothetical protein
MGERAGHEAIIISLIKIKHAARSFTDVMPEVMSFAELKFALRPDQALLMAHRGVELRAACAADPRMDVLDQMAFTFLIASLSHRAGERWVKPHHVRFIDNAISEAEKM